MQSVNFYQLLSKAINDNQGNTGNQTDAVYELFVNNLFTSENSLTCEVKEREYHLTYANFDTFEASGKTPAIALSNILQDMSKEIIVYRHGSL